MQSSYVFLLEGRSHLRHSCSGIVQVANFSLDPIEVPNMLPKQYVTKTVNANELVVVSDLVKEQSLLLHSPSALGLILKS